MCVFTVEHLYLSSSTQDTEYQPVSPTFQGWGSLQSRVSVFSCKINSDVSSLYFLTVTRTMFGTMSVSLLYCWEFCLSPGLWRQCWLLYNCCVLFQHVCPSGCYSWPKVLCYNTTDKRASHISMDLSHENVSFCEQRGGESQLPKQEKENKTLSEVLQ